MRVLNQTTYGLVAVTGLTLLLGGFAYDLLFAGIPYQDPTPELQAKYELHSGVASALEGIGLTLFVVGVLAFLVGSAQPEGDAT